MPDLPQRPSVAGVPLSILLLAHNPGPEVGDVLASWSKYLPSLNRDYELLLVDDGSSDCTIDAGALEASTPRLRVLRHPEPRGLGASLRTGLAAASKPLVCFTVCDR